MSMRVAALNVTQSDDFDIVLNLISQLSNVLEENRVVTNELISVADTLDTDDDDETDSESVTNTAVVSHLLARENDSLRAQVKAQRLKNRAYARLLMMSVHAVEQCLSGLREIVYTKTNESLKVHQKYITAIHSEQQSRSELELENAMLQSKIFGISNILRSTIRASTSLKYERQQGDDDGYNEVELEKSPDYVLGLVQTLADGLGAL